MQLSIFILFGLAAGSALPGSGSDTSHLQARQRGGSGSSGTGILGFKPGPDDVYCATGMYGNRADCRKCPDLTCPLVWSFRNGDPVWFGCYSRYES